MIKRYRLPALGAVVIAILAGVLYIPFLSNALVFDDHNLFTSLAVYDFAQNPFDFGPRTFPYFTLGLVQVLIGSIEAQRIVSLVLHILCAWTLFALLSALLRQALRVSETNPIDEKDTSNQANVLAFIGAAWFAIHPVAAYGAGYLAQRTILFATLFSLLSLWFYRRAFAENRTADIVTAALFYSAAVFSKEHAVMLPFATVAFTSLYGGDFRSNAKRAGLYLLLCAPAAITSVLAAKGVIGHRYEPYVGEVALQIRGIPLLEQSGGAWFVSAVIQMGRFFDYLYYWLIPDVRFISADMRIDFAQTWTSGWIIPKAALFLACPIGAFYCLWRGGRAALFGCGLLYCWLLFITEPSTVRFQEPFVLYRSYLWAPGFVIMLLALLSRARGSSMLAAFVLATPLLFVLAQDRLQSLISERTVWEDAAAKLASPDLPGADRIYYNRGGERFKLGRLDEAMADLNRVVMLNPGGFQGYLGRGKIYLQMGKNREALSELDLSLERKPPKNGLYGLVQYHRGNALQNLGRSEEAMKAYISSAGDGFYLAKLIILHRKDSGM